MSHSQPGIQSDQRLRHILGLVAFGVLVLALSLYQVRVMGAALSEPGGSSDILASLSGYSGGFNLQKILDAPFMHPTWQTTLSYELRIGNSGGSIQSGISVSDPVPEGVTFLANTMTVGPNPHMATYDANTRTINWSGGLVPGERVTITYQARVNTLDSPLQNTAVLTHSSLGAPLQATAVTSATTGYLLRTSDGTDLGTCSTSFTDISPVGTSLGFATAQSASNIVMPFDFTFYGVVSDTVRIGNQGWILFGQRGELPTEYDCNLLYDNNWSGSNAPEMGIFPFCDSLGVNSGAVYVDTMGAAPNRRFIVQWDDRNIPSGNTDGNTVTFQAVLYEDSNRIDFVYHDVVVTGTFASDYSLGDGANVGLRRNDAYSLQYWSSNWGDSYGAGLAPRLHDGLALCFTPIGGPIREAYLPLALRNN